MAEGQDTEIAEAVRNVPTGNGKLEHADTSDVDVPTSAPPMEELSHEEPLKAKRDIDYSTPEGQQEGIKLLSSKMAAQILVDVAQSAHQNPKITSKDDVLHYLLDVASAIRKT